MTLTKKQLKTALDDLKRLYGIPPYDTMSNICYSDGYFANSLVHIYGMPLAELEKVTGFKKAEKAWNKARKNFIKRG